MECMPPFWCWHESGEFVCNEDWNWWVREEKLNSGVPAFLTMGSPKNCVQCQFTEISQHVWDVLNSGSAICVAAFAGDVPKAAHKTNVRTNVTETESQGV